MAAVEEVKKGPRFPLADLGILPVDAATDIHQHTSFSDGKLTLAESFDEAYQDNLYEKGAIEHGNPVDEDISHPTTFLRESKHHDYPYTSKESYLRKFQNIRSLLKDYQGATPLTDADPERLREDLTTIQKLDEPIPNSANAERYIGLIDQLYNRLSDPERISEYSDQELVDSFEAAPKSTNLNTPDPENIRLLLEIGEQYNSSTSDYESFLDDSLNYTFIVPHGVELDYNPAIEMAGQNKQQAVDNYEDSLIRFLKEAESSNAGYNYVLLSSHHVNTPFTPRYVKKDELFTEMSEDEIGGVLETYREKEIAKIESLASKLADLSIPEVSEELMNSSERKELEDFIYSHEGLEGSEVLGEPLNISRPGVFAVGAHPTLIERNEEFMDYFRKQEGITTKEEIKEDLNRVLSSEINKQDVDDFLGEDARSSLYPEEALKEFYQPMAESAESEENFVFEVNGKGVERQHPSVFWEMLDEKVFGSDSHRPGEQPSRSEEFSKQELPGETVFLTEKWISQLED